MIHDELNPYTAVQRSPSQWFLFVPHAAPMGDNTTVLTLSHDAVNLNTIPPTDSGSTLESRYVVPEVVRPSESDVDTRSAGNPYSHHPNFTTPSQYFGHQQQVGDCSREVENPLTVMDIGNLKDPFLSNDFVGAPSVKINPPNDVTMNKTAFSSQSLADLQNLQVHFPTRKLKTSGNIQISNQSETLNKKLLSPESMYELEKIEVHFEKKSNAASGNLVVLRDYSPESLAELRELRNLSAYSDFGGAENQKPSDDVSTCIAMSPSPYERRQFEWSENVAYGGI